MVEPLLKSFGTFWEGGFYEGLPTDPMAPSGYGIFGYHSSLYLTYRMCIKPYIGSDTVALEIGPGRGAWTKAIVRRAGAVAASNVINCYRARADESVSSIQLTQTFDLTRSH